MQQVSVTNIWGHIGFTPRRCSGWLSVEQGTDETLSVDTTIWPEVLSGPEGWIGPNRPFWNSRQALLDYLAKSEVALDHFRLVSAYVMLDPFTVEALDEFEEGFEVLSTVRFTDAEVAAFIGIDVADGFFLSGLLNIDRPPARLALIAPLLEGKVNSNCLFSRVEDALAFRDFCQVDVAEHAPFFCFALQLVGSF